MNYRHPMLCVAAIWLMYSSRAWCYDLAGEWVLNVEDKSHKAIATLTVKFTEQKASSCIGGDWKQVTIVSSKTDNPQSYPVTGPLSYQIDKDQLTIGRNEICDAYLMLSGPINSQPIKGEYYSLGWGTAKLGFFVLMREK